MKTIEQRELNFYKSLVPFLDKYSRIMVREFFNYWTEKNQGGRKMRFEKEKTFDLARRLARWANNDKRWNTNKVIQSESVLSKLEKYG